MEWQPIETAPKDLVTRFDGWNGERVTNVIWSRPEGSPNGANDWCVYEYEYQYGVKLVAVRGLTHWMPIPLPPNASTGRSDT